MKCSRVHLWPVSLFWGCCFGSKPVKGPKSSQQNRKFTWIAKVIPYPIGIIPHITPHPHTVDESIHRIDPRRHWSRRHLAKHEKSASHLPSTGKNPMEAGPKIQKYFTYMLHGCCGACIFSYHFIPASGSLSTVLGKMEENVSMDICMTYLYRNINSSITRIFRIYVEKRGISSKPIQANTHHQT